MDKKITSISIGCYNWYAIKLLVSDQYFVLAAKPLFKGYYSLEMCEYKESRLCKFLTNKLTEQLEDCGVDTSFISNISILNLAQYEKYIKGKLPNVQYTYLTQTPYPGDKNAVYGIGTDGNPIKVEITETCCIRPCMFVEGEYLRHYFNSEIVTMFDAENEEAADKIQHEYVELSESVKADKSADADKQIEVNCTWDDDRMCINEAAFIYKEPINEYVNNTDIEERNDVCEDTETTDTPADIQEALVRTEACGLKEAVSDVYLSGEYSDYAFLLYKNDAALLDLIERYGLTIRSFYEFSKNENRAKVDCNKIKEHVVIQKKRWSWK